MHLDLLYLVQALEVRAIRTSTKDGTKQRSSRLVTPREQRADCVIDERIDADLYVFSVQAALEQLDDVFSRCVWAVEAFCPEEQLASVDGCLLHGLGRASTLAISQRAKDGTLTKLKVNPMLSSSSTSS